jgi:hypothetical protein
MIRAITGYGEGKGSYIYLHDGFLPGSDRVVLDTHQYFAFDDDTNEEPIEARAAGGLPGGVWPARACSNSLNNRFALFSLSGIAESQPKWVWSDDRRRAQLLFQ